jgi:hypothetical protein
MSRTEGLPATLYLFQWGTAAGSFFAYTDADIPIDYDGITYQPIVIGRMGIEASGSLDRKALEIDIEPTASIVRMYADNPPSVKVALTIFQGHVTDSTVDYRTVWSGSVKNLNREPPYAKIIGEPLDGLMARPGLRRYFMFGCPYVLYDTRTCKANPLTHRRTVVPVFIGGNFVRFPSGWSGAIARDDYIGGYVEWLDAQNNMQRRTMEDFGATDDEVIIGNTRQLSSGMTLTIYAGCRRTLDDCRRLHSNPVNYGGQPFIPLENPVDYVNRFY